MWPTASPCYGSCSSLSSWSFCSTAAPWTGSSRSCCSWPRPFTDFLDGRLARKYGLITDFGKIADPIADKALTGSALITLSYLGELPWWVTGLILFREVGVTVLRFWVIRRGVIPASRGGKLKTLLQVVAIGLYVLPGPLGLVREILMAAALVVTLATGGDYVLRAVSLRRGRIAARGARKGTHGEERPEAGHGRAGRGRARYLGDWRPGCLRDLGLMGSRGQTLAVAESLTGGWSAPRSPISPGRRRSCAAGSSRTRPS